MQQLAQFFQRIHQARTRAADQVVVECKYFAIDDRVDGIPAGAGCHLFRGGAVSRVAQQDDLRVLQQQFFRADLRPAAG